MLDEGYSNKEIQSIGSIVAAVHTDLIEQDSQQDSQKFSEGIGEWLFSLALYMGIKKAMLDKSYPPEIKYKIMSLTTRHLSPFTVIEEEIPGLLPTVNPDEQILIFKTTTEKALHVQLTANPNETNVNFNNGKTLNYNTIEKALLV